MPNLPRAVLALALPLTVLAGLALAASVTGQPSPNPSAPMPTAASDTAAINKVLDSLHDLASKADGKNYFALYTPDAIFLGTDATERWTLDQFKAYAEPFFSKGKGWTYTPRDRHIFINGADAPPPVRTAWFDERLDNAKYGECRGTGILIFRDGQWKIAQYNLTVPVPNDLLDSVVEMIRAEQRKTPAAPAR